VTKTVREALEVGKNVTYTIVNPYQVVVMDEGHITVRCSLFDRRYDRIDTR
jgi:hypothetical protein